MLTVFHAVVGVLMMLHVEAVFLLRQLCLPFARLKTLSQLDLTPGGLTRDTKVYMLNLTPQLQLELAADVRPEVRKSLAQNPALTRAVSVMLAKDPSSDVRHALFRSSGTRWMPHRTLRTLLGDPDPLVRAALASYGGVTPAMQKILLSDGSISVRTSVINFREVRRWRTDLFLASALRGGDSCVDLALRRFSSIQLLGPRFLQAAPVCVLAQHEYTRDYVPDRLRKKFPDMTDALAHDFYGNVLELEELCASLSN